MGRKSREKRERRLSKIKYGSTPAKPQNIKLSGWAEDSTDHEKRFQAQIDKIRALFRQYRRPDVALSLCVSELWPANTGSPIKHIFAWRVLLDVAGDAQEGASITSYTDFKTFIGALYAAWPEFIMLEDFSPEADWGQIKTRLAQNFVPMFYGSCLDRTPDFVESFRITYAHVPEAQAQMDLAIALQARIIALMPDFETTINYSNQAHVEVPSEKFWLTCTNALQRLGDDISDWRNKTHCELEVCLGTYSAPLTLSAFGDAVMQGAALPFLALRNDDIWVPMSVRNAPDVVINHWAKSKFSGVSCQAHRRLARFVAERFQYVLMGPLTLLIGDTPYGEYPISCAILAESGMYLIATCDPISADQISSAANDVYVKLQGGLPIHLLSSNGDIFSPQKRNVKLSAENLHFIIVPTQAGTAVTFLDMPLKPTRLLFLADFITIFDSLTDLNELERYWSFVDAHQSSILGFSGAVDMFAAFKDADGVLVEGAKRPDVVMLDPHWGTSWRFKILSNFWAHAPAVFPDESIGWSVFPSTEGVVKLESRNRMAIAYSTLVGPCTVQALIEISEDLQPRDAHFLHLFVQLLADCAHRCGKFMQDIPLFHSCSVLFICTHDPSSLVNIDEAPLSLDGFAHVVTDVETSANRERTFHVRVNTKAVLAGLCETKDGSFEVRCLLETLDKSHTACGLTLPEGFGKRFCSRAEEPARYHLKVFDRLVDVPDGIEPVVPTLTEYKLARKNVAEKIMALGLDPGSYELSEAKARIDSASHRLRLHIEHRLASLDRHQLLQAFIEQHDALLIAERMRIERTRLSLAHAVEYDRLDAVEEARKECGLVARHYRYLLEKVFSSQATGNGAVTGKVLRELVGLVDWYMVLAGASDVLHNDIDAGGIKIDDSYLPEIFYSAGFEDKDAEFARECASLKLGIGVNEEDAVEGESNDLLSSKELKQAFLVDLGFDLEDMLTVLAVLSQAQRYDFGSELSLSYAAGSDCIVQKLAENIEGLDTGEAKKIVDFLTLSETGVRRLAGKDTDEGDVPYWERNKRIHRYTLRPLVIDGTELRWGAETASRSMNIWIAAVRDGALPAEFGWPHVEPVIRKIKKSIEKRLELRTEQIFKRYTPFVRRGVDFYRQFRKEGFEDVGDFDVFAYWPDKNLVVSAECKYNLPPFTMKDNRRLRDRIFGKAENDKEAQFSRIQRRREFLEKNRARLLELLDFPKSEEPLRNEELYVCRELCYWMFHPPYPVSTKFIRVDTLDTWIKNELITPVSHD